MKLLTLSDVIQQLEKERVKHGDVPILIRTTGSGDIELSEVLFVVHPDNKQHTHAVVIF